MKTHTKKTKIIATIGPASESDAKLQSMLRAGMNIARLNFSHGDFAEHERKLNLVRAAAKKVGRNTAILQDLGGPKIRTGNLENDRATLKSGQSLILTTRQMLGTAEKMSVNYKRLPQDVSVGDRILLNDGKQQLVVKDIQGTEVHTKVVVGGKIVSRRGINLPDTTLSLSALTPKDRRDVLFGIEHEVDFIALSFVQSAKDIKRLRTILEKHNSTAQIIAKIETTDAVRDIDSILEATDAVMVARGDLAVEIGPEEVPLVQKEIVRKANALGKPVVVATQMLESMIDEPVPTRAEVSDISNAIVDGADAVMLSAETAMGTYPKKSVETMARVALATEAGMDYNVDLQNTDELSGTAAAVASHAARIAKDLDAKAVVALTETGASARMIARFRMQQPLLVITQQEYTRKQTALLFGTYAAPRVKLRSWTDAAKLSRNAVTTAKIAKKGDTIVVVSGSIFGKPGETNTITVITV